MSREFGESAIILFMFSKALKSLKGKNLFRDIKDRASPQGQHILYLLLIAIIGIAVYSNTFNVPFHFDDKILITENPIIKDLNYFLEPSTAKEHPEYGIFKRRYISFLTFALNYRIHGLDVRGYHITNIAIHILNALLVYILVVLTFQTPFLRSNSPSFSPYPSSFIALFSALIFVSHPVQTEAVTYIMQRFASLVTFFYLLSMISYIKWRLRIEQQTNRATEQQGNKATGKNYWSTGLLLYCSCIASAILAMKTKENSLTLPFAITLYELLFFKDAFKKRMLFLIPLFLLLIIFPLSLSETGIPMGKLLFGIDSGTGYDISRSTFDKDFLQPAYPRWEYFITQFRVIVTYIRLLFLPINQNIDYDYPVYNSFLNPNVFLSFLFLLLIFAFGIYLLYAKRSTLYATPSHFKQVRGIRLIAFGIFCFFLTLSVESSIIPIPMIIAEYRLYLPSVGVIMAFVSAIFYVLRLKIHASRIPLATAYLLLTTAVVVLSIATHQRNIVWQDEMSLWKDVVKKSPEKARGYNNLGNAYNDKGWVDEAIEHYQIAIRLKPDNADSHYNLGIACYNKGLVDEAIEHYQIAVRLRPDADFHNNLGNAYYNKGLVDEAIEHYQIAVRLKPDNADFHNNLGIAYKAKGLTDKAIEHYQIALNLKPDGSVIHFNLGIIYIENGFTDKAKEHFSIARRLNPALFKTNTIHP